MRRSFLIVFLFLTSFNTLAQSKWQEGTHYKVIAQKASAKPIVQEVFSFWCPACNAFETIVPQIKRALPPGIPFQKVHVNFNGSTSKDTQNDATAVMLASKALKTDALFNKALFNTIHQKRTKITSKADILAVYAATGSDALKLESGCQKRQNCSWCKKCTYHHYQWKIPGYIHPRYDPRSICWAYQLVS